MPGVKALYPVAMASLPPRQPVADPELATAVAMSGADVAQSELGLTGAGVRVGVIDSGIDYQHPDLGGCFGAGCRVAVGYDFVGDGFDAADPAHDTPVPDPNPDDCDGHGTHVAGIVGAQGAVTGVAPGVTFGAYRVFGCDGSTSGDVMIAAMERALADRMQVLNMSIGTAFQWPQYPTAQASDRLVNAGVVVVASIGNSGANGVYAASAPGLGEKVIGVASFDNTHSNLATFTISPDNTAVGYIPASGAPPPPTSGSVPMARTGTATSTADACAALQAGSLTGKIALVRRGTCTFYVKALNAQQAGALGVVIYNNQPGSSSASVLGTPAVTVPVVTISGAAGASIDSRLAAGSVTMTWTTQTVSAVNPTGGRISSTSSFGLAPDLSLKPDIGAPGGFIRSTYPLEQGGYAIVSGTSMSAPHVAGGVALLLQARPNTSSQIVRTVLQNSAEPRPAVSNASNLEVVHRQGAGMLNIDDAILSTVKIEPGKLSLGESASVPATRTLSIENKGASAVTFDLSHAPALSTGGTTFAPSFITGFATVAFAQSSVTVPAGGSATVGVTISTNPSLPDRSQYGGYLVFAPQGGGQVSRVPYAGFKGDYQSIPALTPTSNGFPWLAKRTPPSFSNRPGGETYTLVGDDVPYVLVHLDHQVRRLRLEARDADTGRSWHRVIELEYVGRNSTATSVLALPWDGMTTNSHQVNQVPDGKYRIILSIDKALGDGTSAQVETWTSPVITIEREP